ncbi:MAG TPA: Clp protease N-terminal domain-containing protein [Acidimicrobiia bacterium]|nr:Clp protease N-terminal domain-containing protein [Acidimicrobiia bacterium]
MFERFTDRARSVVVAANQEACALGHGHLGTEHLLLGLLQAPQCAAGRALGSLGVSHDAARDHIMEVVPSDLSPGEAIPFTGKAKTVLELSVREALQRGHTAIGTGDLALALLRVRDGTALRVLGDLGVEADVARARVLDTDADTVESRAQPARSVVLTPQLPPHARVLVRRALRVGCSYVARRYVPPRLQRTAFATARFVRVLGARPDAHDQAALPAAPNTPLLPAACLVCGKRPPECGTLYTNARGALICEHCIGEGHDHDAPG